MTLQKIAISLIFKVFFLNTLFAQSFPSSNWKRNLSPTFSGWNIDQLDNLRQFVVDSTVVTGMMLVHNGEIVFEYGNLEENSYIASCRKSVLSMLYGKHVENGTIDLDKSLEEMNIHSIQPLIEIEKRATIKDIISSRSGVYLPASNGGDMSELAPPRGSREPGEQWLYSNWDFNMAGYIFEKETKTNIYDEIENQLAIPLEMQDWNRSLQEKSGDFKFSDIKAYHMWFSTRDMARLGLLMLNHGKWKNQQIISKNWIKESISEKSTIEELLEIAPRMADYGAYFAYGYMWWLWNHPDNQNLSGAYTASGAWGQTITVYPKMNTVLVFKTKNEYERMKGNPNILIEKVSHCYNSEVEERFVDLSKALREEDINAFIYKLREIGHYKSNDLNIENSLNILGYNLLNNNRFSEAIAVFKYNVEQNPTKWNVYDSLGEAFLLAGSYNKAKKYYSKALKLNVNNEFEYNASLSIILDRIDYITKSQN